MNCRLPAPAGPWTLSGGEAPALFRDPLVLFGVLWLSQAPCPLPVLWQSEVTFNIQAKFNCSFLVWEALFFPVHQAACLWAEDAELEVKTQDSVARC